MSNVITTIGHDIKVGVEDAGKAIVDAVEFLPKAERVIASAIKDQPAIKSAVLDLIKQATIVIGDVSTDAADKGINLVADAQTLKDAEDFFAYFKSTFVPLVEQVYGEIAADLK